MKKVIFKIVKYFLLFLSLQFAFYTIPPTILGFKIGMETHNSELASQKAAEMGEMLGREYGSIAFWSILLFCLMLFAFNSYRNKNK